MMDYQQSEVSDCPGDNLETTGALQGPYSMGFFFFAFRGPQSE